MIWLDLFVAVAVAWVILQLQLLRREVRTMGQGLDDLKAALDAETDATAKAVAVLNSIPGLITEALGAEDPDAALEDLANQVKQHTADITAALAASGQEAPPPSPPAPADTSGGDQSGAAGGDAPPAT